MTWSMLGLSSGLVRRHFLMRFLHSSLTLVHSGLGNSYWPDLPSDQSEVSAAALDQSQLTWSSASCRARWAGRGESRTGGSRRSWKITHIRRVYSKIKSNSMQSGNMALHCIGICALIGQRSPQTPHLCFCFEWCQFKLWTVTKGFRGLIPTRKFIC